MTRIREVDDAIAPIADILKKKREEFVAVVRGGIRANCDGEVYDQICYGVAKIDYNKIADHIIKYMETQKRARNR